MEAAPIPDPTTDYARAVVAGEIVVGRLVRLACERHLRDLDEGPARGLRFDPAAARRVFRFFGLLRHTDGQFAQKPFRLHPYQQFIIGSLFGWKKADGARRFIVAYVEIGKGNGKALALDTPLFTPDGWRTMADIGAGDRVFDEKGLPTEVLYATDPMFGHPCFRVGFSDGGEIVADAGHLWITSSLRSGGKHGPKAPAEPRKGMASLKTTAQIAATLKLSASRSRHPQAKWNHRIEVAAPLELPDRELPIPPYTLGAWLGDGDSDSARIFSPGTKKTILAAIKEEGVRVEARKGDRAILGREHGLQAQLRALGILKNKHIPVAYLLASRKQRTALFQGLNDTDGHASKSGQCEFCICDERLAMDFVELARTLGYKPMVTVANAVIYGRVVGKRWRIKFQSYRDDPAFRLPAKASRLPWRPNTRPLSRGRKITGCEPIASVPVKCIRVANQSGLFLAGRNLVPTHNTPLAAGVGLYGLVADGEAGAQIYSAAVTRDQAMLSFVDAENMAKESPEIAERIDFNVGNMAVLESNSFFRAISSEKRGLDGKRVHIALVDELHEHPSAIVVDKMRAGTKSRRQALIFEITNSGYDRNTVCYQHHEYSRQVLEGILADDGWFAYVCQLDPCEKCAADGKSMPTDGCPNCDQWTDEKTWIKANPGLDAILTRQYLAGQVKEARGMPTKENIVRRLNFCQWTEQDVRWLPMADWDACPKTIDLDALQGRLCFGGLDLSATSDFTAFVLCFPPPDGEGEWIWVPYIWIPGASAEERERRDRLPITAWQRAGYIKMTEGNVVDDDFIVSDIATIAGKFAIKDIGFDSWNALHAANRLKDMGFELVEMRQGHATLNEPCKKLEKLVRAHELNHGGHPVLRWMASNVVVRLDANANYAPDKAKSGQKIDAIVAGLMAMGRAIRHLDDSFVYNTRGIRTLGGE